jgi:dienelactone hydrolase
MPANAQGKVPAVVFSHGSEGVSSLYFDVWAKALNAAGYAVFVVDSFKPRNEERVTGATKQLTWNTTANLADALYALKLLATHPQIDSQRIYHMGWSRGGQAVLDAAWPTYQQHVVPVTVKWAGSIAVYPGCNMRYRVDQHSKLPSPLLMLLGEKDDMTLPKPCMELADELAVNGNPVTYKVYVGATHVFDRLNQKWAQYRDQVVQNTATLRRQSSGMHTTAAATAPKTNPDACAAAPDCELLEPYPPAVAGTEQPLNAPPPMLAPLADPASLSQGRLARQRSMDFAHGPALASTATPGRAKHPPVAVRPTHPPTLATSAAASACGDGDETPDCLAYSIQ